MIPKLKHPSKTELPELSWTAVAQKGQLDVVQALLAAGANVHCADHCSETPAYAAVEYGHSRVLARILDSGADIESADGLGNTLLHTAARIGNRACALLLIQRGATLCSRNNHGATPLHSAAERVCEEVSLVFPEVPKPGQDTAEQVRCLLERKPKSVFGLLVTRGADIHARNDRDDTPITEAIGSARFWRELGYL